MLKCSRRMLKCCKRNLKVCQEKINSNQPVHVDSDFIFYEQLLTKFFLGCFKKFKIKEKPIKKKLLQFFVYITCENGSHENVKIISSKYSKIINTVKQNFFGFLALALILIKK